MRIVNKRSVCLLVLSLAGAAFAGEIVPDLSDGLAGFDSEYAATTTVGAPIYTNGVTLAAHITPSADDIANSESGTVNLVEIGGTSKGCALMIKDGNYIFVTKNNANDRSPALEDTDGGDAMLGITLGAATAELDTQVWVSFNQMYGAICYSINGVVDQLYVTGVDAGWNWGGNNTISACMKDTAAGFYAGCADYGDYAAEPYPDDNFASALASSFTGTVSRVQYFNASSLIPAAPGSVVISLTNSIDVLLEWTAGIDAESYNVYRSTTSGVYGEALATGIEDRSYVDSDTEAGVNYFYVITSVDSEDAETEPCDEISINTDENPPAAPTGLSIEKNESLFVLSWDANSETDFDSYSIYRSTESGTYGEAIASGITETSYETAPAELGVTYYYVVRAVDTVANESGSSVEVSDAVTSLDNIRLFFVMDSGAVYGFNSMASNGLNAVDAGNMANGILLTTQSAYSNYQGIAVLPDNTVYGITASGDVMQWTDPDGFIAGEDEATKVASGSYQDEMGYGERIHGCSYDPVAEGFYAVYEGDPADGDIVVYPDLTAFLANEPSSTNAAVYGANKANFYYGWGDVPINYTESDTSDTTGMPYFQVPASGQIEAWLTLDAYVDGPQNRKFELPGFSDGAGNIVAAFALIPDEIPVIITPFDLGIQLDGTTSVVISWSSLESVTYTVQSADSLDGNWTDLESGIAGTGGTMTATASVSASQTFFRVIAQ